jgi:N-methylhydantoinase A
MTARLKYRLGVDVGGTFTDLVFAGEDGSILTKKVPTTPGDYGRGIVDGVQRVLAAWRLQPGDIAAIVHATTVATNTILESRGARTALVTTSGFRDVLEMRRLRIPEMYVLNYKRPEPLVPRNLRFEVDERLKADGSVLRPLCSKSLEAVAGAIADAQVEAVAICLLHSYINAEHEERVMERLSSRLPPSVFITRSADLLPEIREYERTSTTVINAYLGPVLRRYFDSLVQNFAAIGVTAPIQVMKSDGGVMSIQQAAVKPAYIVESGPSAGVIGAADLANRCELPALITLDMGGTTAKASIVESGLVAKSADYEVGAGINLSGRLIMGGGHALKLPVIDISEIGAGGGSVVGFDRSGALTVGPRSAGAVPGPVAYDMGGTDPTLTDAMIVLGYINPAHLVGGDLALDASKARQALLDKVATPIGRSLIDTAFGIIQVAAATMVRAVKAVSTYRGRDPRDFTLFAFGGNGPVLATQIAGLLEMRRVVVPMYPGVFSAYGLLRSPIEHELTRAFIKQLSSAKDDSLDALVGQLMSRLRTSMEGEGCDWEAVGVGRFADLRYMGQAHELTVPISLNRDGSCDISATTEAFHAEHYRTYGRRSDANAVQSVNIRVRGTIPADTFRPCDIPARQANPGGKQDIRRVYFGPQLGHLDTPIVNRGMLSSGTRAGPMILEEYDTTCLIPPDWAAAADRNGNVVLNCREPNR